MIDNPRKPFEELITPGNIYERVTDIETQQTEVSAEAGASSEITENTGTQIVGNLLSPAPGVEVSDVTDSGFTGSFVSGDGATFNGEVYNMGGVNAGALQFGLSQTTGKAYAGAGAVILDDDGITVNTVTTSAPDLNSYKLLDINGNVVGKFSGYEVPGSEHYVTLQAAAVTGENTIFNIISSAPGVGYSSIKLSTSGGFIEINGSLTPDTTYIATTNIQTATGFISSGSYTPTATNVTNMASSSGWVANYMRVHNMVTVWGTASLDPTTTALLTEVRITLPVASALNNSSNMSGVMGRNATATGIGLVVADTTNDQALLRWVTDTASLATYNFHFSYIIQ